MFPKFDVFGCSPLLCIWGVDSCKGTQTEFVRVANFWWVWHKAQAKKEILHRKQYHAINMIQKSLQLWNEFLDNMFRDKRNSIFNCQTVCSTGLWIFKGAQMKICNNTKIYSEIWFGIKWRVNFTQRKGFFCDQKSFVWFVENSSKANTQGEVGIDLGNL